MPRRESSLEVWQIPDDRDNPSLEPRDDRSPAVGFWGSSRGTQVKLAPGFGCFASRSQPSRCQSRFHRRRLEHLRHNQPQYVGLHRRTDTTYGARAGNRTLNLGIKRRLTFLDWTRQGMPGRAWRIRRYDAFVSRSVLACHRLPRVSCHISCQLPVLRPPWYRRSRRIPVAQTVESHRGRRNVRCSFSICAVETAGQVVRVAHGVGHRHRPAKVGKQPLPVEHLRLIQPASLLALQPWHRTGRR